MRDGGRLGGKAKSQWGASEVGQESLTCTGATGVGVLLESCVRTALYYRY
jgi:hypothetical protein